MGGSVKGNKKVGEDVPKGCLAVKVGGLGEEQERFIVPIIYFNHPLFMQLLKEAEDEYGFQHQGPITIPCHVQQFRYVRSIIERDQHHHHHHDHRVVSCFRV